MSIQNISEIPCMILCGGKGTRLRDVTEQLPKPMVPIGDFPIVVHIMKWYAKFGVRKFVLCLGYKKETFVDYFTNFSRYTNDITVSTKDHSVKVHHGDILDWEITLCDTGLETKTGLRVQKAMKYIDTDEFFLTYGDGLSNIDIHQLYLAHVHRKKYLTLTQVKNPTRFGLVETDSAGNILDFKEKNQSDGYINGGFMVVSRRFTEKYLDGSDVFFEQEPLSCAISDQEVYAYTHDGFWQCMDNMKEYELLNSLWKNRNAKWRA